MFDEQHRKMALAVELLERFEDRPDRDRRQIARSATWTMNSMLCSIKITPIPIVVIDVKRRLKLSTSTRLLPGGASGRTAPRPGPSSLHAVRLRRDGASAIAAR